MQLHCITLLAFNVLKILPAYSYLIYSYVKNTRSLWLMFAMIFSNFWKLRHARESSSYYYYYYSCLERLQPCHSGICPNFQLTHLQNIPIQRSGYLKFLFSNACFKIWHKTAPSRRDRSWCHESAGQRPPSEKPPWHR